MSGARDGAAGRLHGISPGVIDGQAGQRFPGLSQGSVVTTAVLEERPATMEGRVPALATAAGEAANALAVQNLARAGDNIVWPTDLHGGTWNMFANCGGSGFLDRSIS